MLPIMLVLAEKEQCMVLSASSEVPYFFVMNFASGDAPVLVGNRDASAM